MTTLYTATLELVRILTNVINSETTGAGSSTTVVDSNRTERDDYWNGGTIWIAGKTRKVLDFSNGTFTVSSLGSAPGSGVSYSLVAGDWPIDKLIEFINMALREIGDIPQFDTTLTTVPGQESYQLPTGVRNVFHVEIASNTAYGYVPHHGVWREVNGYLYFNPGRAPYANGLKILLTYVSPHPVVSEDDDEISDYVHIDRLIWTAAVHAWRWRIQMSQENKPIYQTFYAEALARSERERGRHPISLPVKGIRTAL